MIEVTYTGRYPNYCRGQLIICINGKVFDFPQGSLSLDTSVYLNPWTVIKWPHDFPDKCKDEAVRVINDTLKHECCGGCR